MQETITPAISVPDVAVRPFLSMLGLAARARRLAMGATLARDAARSGRAVCVVLARDASENTKKRLTDTASYYHVPLYLLPATQEILAQALGKRGTMAAVGVTDASFALALQNIYQKFSVCTDDSSEV